MAVPGSQRQRWIAATGVAVLLAVAALYLLLRASTGSADPNDPAQVRQGESVYAAHCASCHGRQLEGQPDWRQRRADGKLPAPPHDESGHTWHHPDRQLFDITKHGLAPIAGATYATDMPAFAGQLSDAEIWAVLAFIKSRWPAEIRARQDSLNRRGRWE